LTHGGAREVPGPLLLRRSAPALGFGAWAVGGHGWGPDGTEAERQAAVALAMERGITFFDTAPTYGAGESERLLGRVLHSHRDRVIIATKVGPRDDPRRSLEDSLRRLDTDYVDLVQLHETQERWEWQLDALRNLQQDGKARAVGLCNASAPQLVRALEIAPLGSFQAAYNLFDRDVEPRELPLVRERGLAFLAYRPLASGLLTGKYATPPRFATGDHRSGIYWFKGREFLRRQTVIAQLRPLAAAAGTTLSALALRWLLARDGVTVVLAGARNRAQVEENLAAQEGPLDDSAVARIDAVVRAAFRLPRASRAAVREAQGWGPRERFIVDRLDGAHTAEAIAAEWTDGGDTPMVAAQVKVFVDGMAEHGLVDAEG
jgi:aryl-alcohol dehydrogenase-like predicted oxidoreductase